jgi:uroporphyrinogen-III synthase
VHQSIPRIRRYFPTWPPNTRIASLGAGTASVLAGYHLTTALMPEKKFTSESFVNLPEFFEISQKKILLIRGMGGKTLLAETLQSRHAHLFHAIVYKRELPPDKTQELSRIFQQKIDAIVSTSEENLANLWKIAAESDKPKLRATPLLVISENMVALAEKLGFSTLILTDNPQDETIVRTLLGKPS